MTARDTITEVIAAHEWFTEEQCVCGWQIPAARNLGPVLSESAEELCGEQHRAHQTDAVIAAIRAMPHDDLTELRPDIATEYHAHLDTAATRGHYLLTRLRAHTATQEAS